MLKNFSDEVHSYQNFVVDNFETFPEYTILQEQFQTENGFVDILAYNHVKKRLAIIELKNTVVNKNVVAQCMMYYHDLKDKQIDGYQIMDTPELVVISPFYDKSITIPKDVKFRMIRMNYEQSKRMVIAEEVFPIIEELEPEEYHEIKLKDKKFTKQSDVPKEQMDLARKIVSRIQGFYGEKLEIIFKDGKIDILYGNMIAKIIFNTKWFESNLQLIFYKNSNIIPIDVTKLRFDSAVVSSHETKTMIKLKVKSVPDFLKSKLEG